MLWTKNIFSPDGGVRIGWDLLCCCAIFVFLGFSYLWKRHLRTGLLKMVARQIGVSSDCWQDYSGRAATRREHALELQEAYGLTSFTKEHVAPLLETLAPLAATIDRGSTIATALTAHLREQGILLPTPGRVEELSAMAITAGWRHTYRQLSLPLSAAQKAHLEAWLQKSQNAQEVELENAPTSLTPLRWLLQPLGFPSSRSMLGHIETFESCGVCGLVTGRNAFGSPCPSPPTGPSRCDHEQRRTPEVGADAQTGDFGGIGH